MRFAVITSSELPLALLAAPDEEEKCVFITDQPAVARKARQKGFRTAVGALDDAGLYRRARISPQYRVLIYVPRLPELNGCLRAVLEALPGAPVTALFDPDNEIPHHWRDQVLFVSMNHLGSVCLFTQMEKAAARRSLSEIRTLFRGAERILLLLQDDPDPDGLASALALRTLLGRNRVTAVIGSFGEVRRPENVAMVKHLDIQPVKLRPEELAEFDRIALIDVQPFHSPLIPTEIDLVIDHHPRRANYNAAIKDVRPRYGATSTIMTEYLLASDTPISQRLATALLYGIKTDTQLLGRDTTPADVAAFAALYPLANHALLRRIDRPQFPRRDLPALSFALQHARIDGDVLVVFLGPLTREDVIPYIADFCLELEGVEWSVVAGLSEGRLIISVRTYGGGRNAGEVVKEAFEQFGSAGGHKATAKAVIPLERIPAGCSDNESWIRDRFLSALSEGDQTEKRREEVIS